MTDDIAIKVDNVSKTFKLPHEKTTSIKTAFVNFWHRDRRYEKQEALKGVSFEIKKGEFFGIVGRNGSGKSTLLKMLAGIYPPTKGNVTVNGKLTPFIELGVGFNPELTGRENVFLNGALLGLNRKEMGAMYKDIVDFAEIERFMDQKLKNYSSGMQVRLAFSIAIRIQSDILILDEVLAVGDAAFQQKCFDYFEELREQNKTVVFVTHDMNAVKRFCTTAIYIKDGKLLHEGSPAEISDVYLEENMEANTQQGVVKSTTKLNNKHKVEIEVSRQTDIDVVLHVTYESKDKDEVYVGISVVRDGLPIGEINTIKQLKLENKGTISYTLDTTILNPGVYYLAAALFKRSNRELIGLSKEKSKFILKDTDNETDVKSAAIKLADTWKSVGASSS